MLSAAGVVAVHGVVIVGCMNYITAAATWDTHYCQWPFLHASADVKSDRWYPCSHARHSVKWCGPPTCT